MGQSAFAVLNLHLPACSVPWASLIDLLSPDDSHYYQQWMFVGSVGTALERQLFHALHYLHPSVMFMHTLCVGIIAFKYTAAIFI